MNHLPHHLLRGMPHKPAKFTIRKSITPFEVFTENALRHYVHQRMIECFRFAQTVLRLADAFLRERLLRDVPEHPLQTHDRAVLPVERGLDDLHHGFLLTDGLMLLRDFITLPRHHYSLIIREIFFCQINREEIKIRLAENFLQRATVMPAILLVRKREPPLQIFAEHMLRHRLHQRVIQRLGITHILLRHASRRDVFHRALVMQQQSLRIADHTAVLRNPDDAPVLAENLRLKSCDRVVLIHDAPELLASSRRHVKPAADVRHARHQFFRVRVTVDARDRGIGQQITSVRRRLKNPFHQMIEDAVILFLRAHQRQISLMPLDGVPDGTQQPGGVDVALDEIILRARVNRLHRDGFIIHRTQHDHRHERRRFLKEGDVRETRAIGKKKLQKNDAEVLALDAA